MSNFLTSRLGMTATSPRPSRRCCRLCRLTVKGTAILYSQWIVFASSPSSNTVLGSQIMIFRVISSFL